jgi:hypothetical protein
MSSSKSHWNESVPHPLVEKGEGEIESHNLKRWHRIGSLAYFKSEARDGIRNGRLSGGLSEAGMMAHLSSRQPLPSTKPLDVGNPAFSEEGMLVLMLNESGFILNSNMIAVRRLTCTARQLLWQPISNFLPILSGTEFIKNGRVDPHLRFLSRIGHRFEIISQDGEGFLGRVFFNEVENYGQRNLCLVIWPDMYSELKSEAIK